MSDKQQVGAGRSKPRDMEKYGMARVERDVFIDLQKIASDRGMRIGALLTQWLRPLIAQEKLRIGRAMVEDAERELGKQPQQKAS